MKNSFTDKDTQALIKTYEVSLRQLEYQVAKTKATIAELEDASRPNGKRAERKSTAPAKRARSKRAAVIRSATPKVARKRGRPRKVALKPQEPTAPDNPKGLVKAKAKRKKEEGTLLIPKASKPKTSEPKIKYTHPIVPHWFNIHRIIKGENKLLDGFEFRSFLRPPYCYLKNKLSHLSRPISHYLSRIYQCHDGLRHKPNTFTFPQYKNLSFSCVRLSSC